MNRVKQERDNERVRQCLDQVVRAAENDENLLPPMLDAVRAYASVGEICKALIPVFGTYRETSVL